METPVKVVGCENVITDKGNPGIRLFVERELQSEDCAGVEALRFYINPEYCKYVPVIGDMLVIIEGRYPGSVDRVIKVG